MPCYFFTYHGHGTWMPDHQRGYVRRKEGVLATDSAMAENYRRNQKFATSQFDERMQKLLIEETLEACLHQQLRGHGIATESTHLHVLVSWRTDRTWQEVRRSLRSSLTRRLNREVERRTWFSKQPSRKRVEDRDHFDYLTRAYLPQHAGWKWSEERGLYL